METTIKISNEVKSQLDKMKLFERETYNDVLINMIEDSLELNEQTKKQLEVARKNEKTISHEEVGKLLGL